MGQLIHIDDFLASVRFLLDAQAVDGVVHVTSPNPVRNRDMMTELRRGSSTVVPTDAGAARPRRCGAAADRSWTGIDRPSVHPERA